MKGFSNEYKEGRQAALRGQPLKNPYSAGSDKYNDYEAGFSRAIRQYGRKDTHFHDDSEQYGFTDEHGKYHRYPTVKEEEENKAKAARMAAYKRAKDGC